MYRVLIFSIFIASASAACTFDPAPSAGLDVQGYKGRWYLIESGPLRNGSAPLACTYETLVDTENPLVFNLAWTGQLPNGTVVPDSGLVVRPNPTRQPARLNFYIDNAVFHSRILATDYTNWALEYSCHEEINWERFMIRGRARYLDLQVHRTLLYILQSYGVNTADFAVVNHSNCNN